MSKIPDPGLDFRLKRPEKLQFGQPNPKKIEIKIADEMAETGYLAYRIKKK